MSKKQVASTERLSIPPALLKRIALLILDAVVKALAEQAAAQAARDKETAERVAALLWPTSGSARGARRKTAGRRAAAGKRR